MRNELIKQKQSIAYRTIQASDGEGGTPKGHGLQFATISQGRIGEIGQGRQESARVKPFIAHFQKKINDNLQYKILRNVFRNKDQESAQAKSNIKSQKLVGKESFIVRQLSPQVARSTKRHGKLELQDSPQRKQESIHQLLRLNQNMRNISGQTNAFLLKSIEMLRSSEKNYLNTAEDQHARKESLVDLAVLEDNACEDRQQDNSSILRSLKEQAAARFKEKIKIKQSRRHIYRTLKNKNENWQKIRHKTHQLSPQKERATTEVKENSELQLVKVQCPEGKQASYNIRSSNFRSLTKTYYDNMRELRVQSKQQSQQGHLGLELRTTKCAFGASDDKEGESWSKGKRKSGIQVFEEVISKMKKGKSGREADQTTNGSPRKNVFRELTPWHFEE